MNAYHTLAESYFNMSLGQELGFVHTDALEWCGILLCMLRMW